MRIPRATWWVVVAAYLLPLVFAVPVMEDDEGLHAAIAQEMVERGDWTVPRLMGEPFLDKPVLYFWMQAASLTVLGQSELSVRLPGTLMALAGVLAIGWLAGRMFGTNAGRWAALCYATMLLPYGVSLVPLHDLVMVPLTIVAFGALWHARHAASTASLVRWTAIAGVALGLSLLGKGLTGLGLVGIGVVVWLLWTRAVSWRLVIAGSAAVLLAASLAWPWYAAMERASPGYLHYYFLQRHLGGLTENTQPHAGRAFWYYVPIFVVGTWPWLIYLRRLERPPTDAERLIWCWLAADVVLLSVAGSKLETYILPSMPAAAALAAVWLARGPASGRSRTMAFWASTITAFLPLAALVFLAQRHETSSVGLTWTLLASTPLAALLWTSVGSRRISWAGAPQLAFVTAATLLAASLSVRPLAATELTARDLAQQFNRAGVLPRTILIVDEGIGSFIFYLRPELRQGLTPDRVRRISRAALLDDPDTNGVMVGVAADRAPGLAALYDFPVPARAALGTYLIVPLAAFKPKAPDSTP